uniref:Putative ovule protein n=1 Tax=Solanum chacoense TaxID=4108 RepID=A0A0V0H3D7_SOLCH
MNTTLYSYHVSIMLLSGQIHGICENALASGMHLILWTAKILEIKPSKGGWFTLDTLHFVG